MDKILLFIPGYNCENQITRVLSQLDSNILNYINEIIFINNRSTDNTEETVRDFISQHGNMPIKILRNRENYNLGGSHKIAFNYAIDNVFDYIVVLHGDDQGNIKDFYRILEDRTYKKYDAVLGARFKKNSKLIGYSKFRIFGNRVYNFLFSLALFRPIYDLGSGLNMYKVESLKNHYYDKFPDNLTFNYCMIMAANYYKQNIEFIPISWREDDQVSNVKMTSQAFSVLFMLIKYCFMRGKFIKSNLVQKEILKYNYDDVTCLQ